MTETFRTAKTYENCEKIGNAYKKNGKMYQKVKYNCPRCGGLGFIVSHVENDNLIPIPVDNGICYKCEGAKTFTKEVRLYTEKEYERMEENKEKARLQRMKEQEERMKAEYADKKREWIQRNGFNEEGKTYIVSGDTYSIKDELKSKGYIFNPILKWHKSFIDEEYKDRYIEINIEDIVQFTTWGAGNYLSSAKEFVENKLNALLPESKSNWIGEVGDKIKDLSVTLVRRTSFQGQYGLTNIFNFVDDAGNRITWFTSTSPQIEEDSKVIISCASIKKHDEYKGEKITVILRPKFKEK